VAFLGADQPVEDWGGGTGWAKMYFTGSYKNIDGSAHKNVDLTNYKNASGVVSCRVYQLAQ